MNVFLSVILIIIVVAFCSWNTYGIVKDIVNARRTRRKKNNEQDKTINKE